MEIFSTAAKLLVFKAMSEKSTVTVVDPTGKGSTDILGM